MSGMNKRNTFWPCIIPQKGGPKPCHTQSSTRGNASRRGRSPGTVGGTSADRSSLSSVHALPDRLLAIAPGAILFITDYRLGHGLLPAWRWLGYRVAVEIDHALWSPALRS